MSHYFVSDDKVKSERRNLFYSCNDVTLKFISDNGVFSKNEIDEGSDILLRSYLKKGKVGKTLDVGAGVGVIGITISKLNNVNVTMLEINKRAVDLCSENIRCNDVVDKCEVLESDIYEKVSGLYDVVISNPPIRAGKKVVFEVLERAKEFLNENGELWAVIRKNQGADSAKKKMMEVYGNCEIVKRDRGFYILKSCR